MKKVLLGVLCLSVMSMVGCSKDFKGVELKQGVIYNNGTATNVTEHCGDSAKLPYAMDTNFSIEFSLHSKFADCAHNDAKVSEADVSQSSTNKNITYFQMYQGSQYVMHYKTDDGLICAYLYTNKGQDAAVTINQLEQTITSLDLSYDYNAARIDEVIEIHDAPSFKVTKENIQIPDVLLVAQGTVNTTDTREFGKKTVGFVTNAGYDYYVYEGYTVKCLAGTDISKYINFLDV